MFLIIDVYIHTWEGFAKIYPSCGMKMQDHDSPQLQNTGPSQSGSSKTRHHGSNEFTLFWHCSNTIGHRLKNQLLPWWHVLEPQDRDGPVFWSCGPSWCRMTVPRDCRFLVLVMQDHRGHSFSSRETGIFSQILSMQVYKHKLLKANFFGHHNSANTQVDDSGGGIYM